MNRHTEAATVGPAEAPSVAGYYDEFWSPEAGRRYLPDPDLLRLILTGATPGTHYLDVGCGTGNSYAGELVRAGAAYVGVDVSGQAVETARSAGLDARVIDDAAVLPFEDASFDVALCVEVLEHLFAPDQAVREIRRVLRPGGRLIASVPNVAYWRLRANLLFGLWNPVGDELSIEQPWRDPHVRFFTPKTLGRMLEQAGYAQVNVTARNGCLLDHLSSRPTSFGRSRIYARLERLAPSLLGMTVHGVAVA